MFKRVQKLERLRGTLHDDKMDIHPRDNKMDIHPRENKMDIHPRDNIIQYTGECRRGC